MCRVPLTVLILMPIVIGMNFNDWQCGSDEHSRGFAYGLIQSDCPEIAGDINHCCVIHDDCYVRQLGQTYCDEQFCKCNQRVFNNTENKHTHCKSHTEIACFVMPLAGSSAYTSSENYTEPEGMHVCTLPDALPGVFPFLYESCPKIKSILSSCCAQLSSCSPYSESCARKANECMLEASLLDRQHTCSRAIGIASVKIERVASESYSNILRNNVVFVILVLLSVLFAVALLSITYKYYRLRRVSSKADMKYMMVS